MDVEKSSENSQNFLAKIYSILVEENVFEPKIDEKLICFEFPDDLKKKINLNLDNDQRLPHDVLEDLCRQVIRHSIKTNHPHFHSELFGPMDLYGLAGSWITNALNTCQYTYELAPILSLIEDAVIEKSLDLFGFKNGEGMFTPGGSIANMYGMVIARQKKFPDIKSTGLYDKQQAVAFTSEDAHYSIEKSMNWLGFGTDNLRNVKTDRNGCMMITDLEEQIQAAIADGKIPFFVNVTAGTTVLGAFDNIREIRRISSKYGMWLHVDGALGGSGILSQKKGQLFDGVCDADSVAWCPQKTVGVPLQCALIILKEKENLMKCNSAEAIYLFQKDKYYDVAYDSGDKSIQCGRNIDAFKMWLMFKARGNLEIGATIDRALATANDFLEKIKHLEGFIPVLDEFQYSNICFWYIPQALRVKEEDRDEKWWLKIHEFAPMMKKMMISSGNILLGYSSQKKKNRMNFFRIVITAYSDATAARLDEVIAEMNRLGNLYPFKK